MPEWRQETQSLIFDRSPGQKEEAADASHKSAVTLPPSIRPYVLAAEEFLYYLTWALSRTFRGASAPLSWVVSSFLSQPLSRCRATLSTRCRSWEVCSLRFSH